MANRYIPPAPSLYGGTVNPRGGDTIAQLLLLQGQQQADDAYNRGDILANTIAGVGQQIGQGIQAHQEQKAASKRAEAFNNLFSGSEMPDPNEIIRVLGPKDGIDVIKGLQALHPQTSYKDRAERFRDAARGVMAVPEAARPQAYAAARQALIASKEATPDEIPEEYDPNRVMQAANYGVAPAAPKEPALERVEERQPDGSVKIKLVPKVAGEIGISAPPPLTAGNMSGEEAFIRAQYGEKPTADQILQGRARFAAAGRDPKSSDVKLTRVEHDDGTGHTVVEYLPDSALRGQKFTKGLGATDQNRANMAETVNNTGNDIISKLSDPKYAEQVGIAMGRFNNLREFLGNPPPEFAELAGEIESYSLASMGVHGMRNVKGAEKIKALLDGKHDPKAIIAAIKGLNSFSADYLKTVGRKPASGGDGIPTVSSPEEARKLPKGSKFRTPDGRVLQVP